VRDEVTTSDVAAVVAGTASGFVLTTGGAAASAGISGLLHRSLEGSLGQHFAPAVVAAVEEVLLVVAALQQRRVIVHQRPHAPQQARPSSDSP